MKLFVTEFLGGVPSLGGALSIPRGMRGHHVLEIGDQPSISPPVDEETTLVRLLAEAPCSVAFGDEVIVTPEGPLALMPGIAELVGITRGARISVIGR